MCAFLYLCVWNDVIYVCHIETAAALETDSSLPVFFPFTELSMFVFVLVYA